MKHLYLLRHSKAGQTNKNILDDHERNLTEKGEELCPFIGVYLAEQNFPPDYILCSSAVRTQETMNLVVDAMAKNISSDVSQRLYLATIDDLYSILHEVPDHVSSLLVVGHNPGLQQLALDICGTGDKRIYRAMRNNFPPTALVSMDIPLENWLDIKPQCAELTAFTTGKKLKDAAT